MKSYLLSLLFVSAITSGALYLSAGSRYEKHLRYLCALLTLLALLAPLPAIFSEYTLPTLSEEGLSLPSSEYGTLLKAETEKRLVEELTHRVTISQDLSNTDFSIVCRLRLEEESALLSFESISVELRSLSAIAKREEIRKELQPFCQTIYFSETIGKKREDKN